MSSSRSFQSRAQLGKGSDKFLKPKYLSRDEVHSRLSAAVGEEAATKIEKEDEEEQKKRELKRSMVAPWRDDPKWIEMEKKARKKSEAELKRSIVAPWRDDPKWLEMEKKARKENKTPDTKRKSERKKGISTKRASKAVPISPFSPSNLGRRGSQTLNAIRETSEEMQRDYLACCSLNILEFLMYVVFLTFFLGSIYWHNETVFHEYHKGVVKNFEQTSFDVRGSSRKSFEEITSTAEYQSWFDNVLLNTWTRTDNNGTIHLTIPLTQAYLLGNKISIRQIRSQSSVCPELNFLGPEYNVDLCYRPDLPYEKKKKYFGIEYFTGGFEQFYAAKSQRYYSSGGFNYFLYANESNATAIVDRDFDNIPATQRFADVYNIVRNLTFIDVGTRAVFIKFDLYDFRIDSVLSNIFLCETTFGGNLQCTGVRYTTYLLPYHKLLAGNLTDPALLPMFFETIAYIFVLLYTLEIVYTSHQIGGLSIWVSLDTAWHVVELANLAIFYVLMFLRIYCLFMIKEVTQDRDIMSVNWFQVGLIVAYINSITSFNAFLSIIKSFKYISANHRISQFTETVMLASVDMIVFSCVLGILLVGFAVSFNVGFGMNEYKYKDFYNSLYSLCLALIGIFEDLMSEEMESKFKQLREEQTKMTAEIHAAIQKIGSFQVSTNQYPETKIQQEAKVAPSTTREDSFGEFNFDDESDFSFPPAAEIEQEFRKPEPVMTTSIGVAKDVQKKKSNGKKKKKKKKKKNMTKKKTTPVPPPDPTDDDDFGDFAM
eukprot:g1802.t1